MNTFMKRIKIIIIIICKMCRIDVIKLPTMNMVDHPLVAVIIINDYVANLKNFSLNRFNFLYQRV